MTHKYEEVKRAIWESKPDKELNPRRTVKEIRTTISFRFWIILGIAFAATITAIVLVFLGLFYWCVVLLLVDLLMLAVSDWLGEKIYNVEPRKAELKKQKREYLEYVKKIRDILQVGDIETKDQIASLKAEAKDNILKFETRFNSVQVKIKDLLFVIPLTALLELLWTTKPDINPSDIMSFIVWGLIFFSFFSIVRSAYVHHFSAIRKDYYLLQMLYELDYQE